jgi:hypothetical protein
MPSIQHHQHHLPLGGGWNDHRRWSLPQFLSGSARADSPGSDRLSFRQAVTDGIKHGRKIGDYAFNPFLRPVQGAERMATRPEEGSGGDDGSTTETAKIEGEGSVPQV